MPLQESAPIELSNRRTHHTHIVWITNVPCSIMLRMMASSRPGSAQGQTHVSKLRIMHFPIDTALNIARFWQNIPLFNHKTRMIVCGLGTLTHPRFASNNMPKRLYNFNVAAPLAVCPLWPTGTGRGEGVTMRTTGRPAPRLIRCGQRAIGERERATSGRRHRCRSCKGNGRRARRAAHVGYSLV